MPVPEAGAGFSLPRERGGEEVSVQTDHEGTSTKPQTTGHTAGFGDIRPIECERQFNGPLSSHQELKQFNPCFSAFVIQPPLKHPEILVITDNN